MINSVVLVGRLTKEPELRKTTTGKSVMAFTLAVRKRFVQQGTPDADFINCVAWNKTAELMAQYLHKGSMVGVEGRISTRNYENNQGQRVYVTEVTADNVTFLDSRNSSPNSYQQGGYNQGYNAPGQVYGNSGQYGMPNDYGYGAGSYQQPANNYNTYQDHYNEGNYQTSAPAPQPKASNTNPYTSPMNNPLDEAFDDDENFDIDTDDLPF